MRALPRGVFAAAAVLAIMALALAAWRPNGPPGGLEGRLLDLRFVLRGPLPAPDGVAVVVIDDRDVAAMGRYPPPRDVLATAVADIFEAGAAAVALDLLLFEASDGDAALAASLRDSRSPVVLAVAAGGDDSDGSSVLSLERSAYDITVDLPDLYAPVPRVPVAALAAEATLGHVNVLLDPEGNLRRIPAAIPVSHQREGGGATTIWLPSLALAALRQGLPDRFSPLLLRGTGTGLSNTSIGTGDATVPLDSFGAVPLVHYGPTGTITTWPLRDARRADLSGQVVFLGIVATGAGDRHATPFDPMLPGVEAQAALAANFLEQRHLRRDAVTWAADLLLAPTLALVAYFAVAFLRPLPAVMAASAVVAAATGGIHLAFLGGWWLDAVTALTALLLGITTATVLRGAHVLGREANLTRYHSPLLVEALASAATPAFDGRPQQAVAVFVDVVGFTASTEAAGPDATVDFIARFHAAVEAAALGHRGVVEQFAGDGAMVIFGLPEPGPNDAADALAFVAAIHDEMRSMAVPVRIGAHAGRVRATVAGGARHRHVTVVGDVVNAASRLQDLAREVGASVAVSDAVLQQTGVPRRWALDLNLRDIGLRTLRGHDARLHVWSNVEW